MAHKFGLGLAVLFVICFLWYFINPVEQELHLSLLKLSYIGFSGMDALSFILGLVQTYIWGYIVVAAFKVAGGARKMEKCGKGDCKCK